MNNQSGMSATRKKSPRPSRRSAPGGRLPALCALACALGAGMPAFSQQPPPDAGRTLRDLQTQPVPAAPRAAPAVTVPADADSSASTDQRFAVTEVRIEGNKLIPTPELLPLVAGIQGRESSLGELRQAASRITALYRERGYIVARAYVPAQELKGGVVVLQVLEGSLNASSVANQSIVQTPVLENIIAAQALGGRTVQADALDRELLLMADLPAVGAVNGMLKPGATVGTSDLFITADAGKAYEGQVTLDNYGNRYTGQTRLSAALDVNSPFRIGDRLGVRATATDEALLYGQISYDLPVNGNGWRAGAVLSSGRYDLGREFDSLDATGTAHTAGIYTSYPIVRGLNANVWVRGALSYRKLKDEIHAVAFTTDKSATLGTLDFYGDLADAWGKGAYSTWRASATTGKLDIDTPAALRIDQLGPRSNGGYRKFELAASRLQAIAARTSAFAGVSGQWAGKNLDSSEKMVLGGMQGVRAYPQGEGAGDSGWLANLELRQDFAGGLQGSLFYDYGHVKFNETAFAAGPNELTLKGYGIGLGARYDRFDIKATLAWRDGQQAQSAPDRSPRLWVMGRWSF